MLKTWKDTHYQLDSEDWLYIAKHEDRGAASLVCPGYARDGCGFSIHFTPDHIELLKNLITVLQSCASQPVNQPINQLVNQSAVGDSLRDNFPSREIAHNRKNRGNGYKYPAPESQQHLIQ
jgi:hypothetical protein